MTLKFSKTFRNSMKESSQLQLDFLLCQLLHRTPVEIQELERTGKLTFEQKCFLEAGILWAMEQGFGQCPFR